MTSCRRHPRQTTTWREVRDGLVYVLAVAGVVHSIIYWANWLNDFHAAMGRPTP